MFQLEHCALTFSDLLLRQLELHEMRGQTSLSPFLNIRVRMQINDPSGKVFHSPLVTSDLALVFNFSHNCPSSNSVI
jgi:hypothetical protein